MDLALLAAHWYREWIRSDQLQGIAIEALEAGLDSPALRQVAAYRPAECNWDVSALFEKALGELGVVRESQRDEALRLAQDVARQLVAGEIDFWEGVQGLVREWDNDQTPELVGFVLLDDDADHYASDARKLNEIRRKILQEAEQLLSWLAEYFAPADPKVAGAKAEGV